MRKYQSLPLMALLPILLLIASGCADEGTNLPVETGALIVDCSLVPVGLDSVTAMISQITATLDGKSIALLGSPVIVHLMDLGGTATTELARADVPIGEYSRIAVRFDGVTVVQDSLRLPAGLSASAMSGAQYQERFVIRADSIRNMVLEINLFRSISTSRIRVDDHDSLVYHFSPVIRAVDRTVSGHAIGRVANPEHRASVYLIAGLDTVSVVLADAGSGMFTSAYLQARSYSLLARDTLGRTAKIDSLVVRAGMTVDAGELTMRPL